MYRVDDKTVPSGTPPRIIRDKVFKIQDDEFKTKKISTPLWSMVARSTRSSLIERVMNDLNNFVPCTLRERILKTVLRLRVSRRLVLALKKATLFEDYRVFYAKSHF